MQSASSITDFHKNYAGKVFSAMQLYLLLQQLHLFTIATIFRRSLRLQQQRNLLLGGSSGFASRGSFLSSVRV